MSFTHLQVRSGYSFLDSVVKIDKLVKNASELEFNALALTDENVLYGVVPFYKKCLEYGIKPIIGMVIRVENDGHIEHCVLLAKNNEGYKQLVKLSTKINTEKITAVNIQNLHPFVDDLICILPVYSSELSTMLRKVTFDQAKTYLDTSWYEVFSEQDFYLGVQADLFEADEHLLQTIKSFHETCNIPTVAIGDVRYLEEQDNVAYDCLQSIKDGKQWTENNSEPFKKQHLLSTNEMKQAFSEVWPGIIEQTNIIAEKCEVILEFNQPLLPSFPVPKGYDVDAYLEKLCKDNLELKYENINNEVSERLTYELNVISEMQFSDYFLIVWDFVNYAKENDIVVGPGRGSAAGSIVAYLLGITDVDPIKYNLLFERFLNPERKSMPDIDIDFSDYRRDEVIDYIGEKYGIENVAQIGTFGTFGKQSVIRELIKTIGIDHDDGTFVLRELSASDGNSIVESVQASTALQNYIRESSELRTLFRIAVKLEGLPRYISTHPAGIVISKDKLVNRVPLTSGSRDLSLTQYPMDDLEAFGLLKIDLLGLRNLSFLEQIMKAISYSLKQSIQLKDIPKNDHKTYDLLRKGRTNGIFQLESQGMKQVLTKLKPSNFEDIVAVNALYRPGPMDNIPTYINRKHGIESITYPHDDLKSILKPTYGVLVYQEQMMEILHRVAGFSYGEADLFRRAISKKKGRDIERLKGKFITGSLENGYKKTTAEDLFSWLVQFSDYGFNRSHAVAYSKIAYYLAYFKAHYPAFFLAELLSSAINQQKRTYQYIQEAKNMGIDILPPSVNYSKSKYMVENNNIRIGLLAIKGIGKVTIQEILHVRNDAGRFTDLFDFSLRTSFKTINRTALESLIIAGAFDDTHNNRASLLASIDKAMDQAELFREFNDQLGFLQDSIQLDKSYTEMEDFSQLKKLKDEKELLGFYISSHPLKHYRDFLNTNNYITIKEAYSLIGRRNVKSGAIIESIKTIRTKRGDPMAFITISDEHSSMDAVIFPDLFRAERSWLNEEAMVTIYGKIEERNNRIQWLANQIKPFPENDENEDVTNARLFIKTNDIDGENSLRLLKDIAKKYPGNIPIIIFNAKTDKTYKLDATYNVTNNFYCLQELYEHFTQDNVVLKDY